MRAYVLLVAALVLAWIPPVPATACSGNDCFSSPVGHFGNSLSGSNAGATMEVGEPAPCQMSGSLWYTITPRSSGTLNVYLSGEWFSAMAIYTGDALGDLDLVTCQTTHMDPEGDPTSTWFPPDISIPCVTDQPLRIQVGGMSGATGTFSMNAWGCTFDPTLPDAPRWCWMQQPCWSAGKNSVTLSFIPPNWDGGELTSITHFNIYRAPTCSSAFTLIGQHPAQSWVQTYVDSGLPAGVPNCYRVHAVNSVGEGPASTLQVAAPWALARPPTTITLTPVADGALGLEWGPSPDANKVPTVTGYRVYGASSESDPFLLLGQFDRDERVFIEGGLGRDATRYYRITVLSGAGEGPASTAVSATTPHPPSPPRSVTVTSGLFFTSNPLVLSPVQHTVRWQAPLDAPWLEGYEIYVDGALAGTVGPGATSFAHNGRASFAEDHYTVVALNAAGSSAPSASACASWPPGTPLSGC